MHCVRDVLDVRASLREDCGMSSVIETPVTRYDSFSSARDRFRDLLDTAGSGRIVSVKRPNGVVAVLPEQYVRALLASRVGSPVKMVFEDDAWAALIPGLPLAAEATSPDDVVDELIAALREYVTDWHDRLSVAPNHADNWPLVEFVGISDDDQLRAWITGS